MLLLFSIKKCNTCVTFLNCYKNIYIILLMTNTVLLKLGVHTCTFSCRVFRNYEFKMTQADYLMQCVKQLLIFCYIADSFI